MKKIVLLISVVAMLAVPSVAQWTVYDPTNYANAIKRYMALQQQIAQMQKDFALATTAYNLALSQSQTIKNLPTRYRYTFQNWQQFAAPSTYGNTNHWVSGINSGDASQIQAAYRQVVPSVSAVAPPKNPSRATEWKQQYGLLELQDATTMTSAKTVGDIRTNVTTNKNALSNLETDSLSPAPDISGAVAVLQKINAANLLLIHQLQDTNRLLVALTELQLQNSMQQRFERGRQLQVSADIRTGTNN